MVTTITKRFLSGSTDGKQIAIGTSPVLIHTATSASGTKDEIYLDVVNNSTTDVAVTMTWGGTDSSDVEIILIPFQRGIIRLRDGHVLGGGNQVYLSAATSAAINAVGWVHRIVEV